MKSNMPISNEIACPVQTTEDCKVQYWTSPQGVRYVRKMNEDGKWGGWKTVKTI